LCHSIILDGQRIDDVAGLWCAGLRVKAKRGYPPKWLAPSDRLDVVDLRRTAKVNGLAVEKGDGVWRLTRRESEACAIES
jgi:hypothetical protein